MQDIPFSIPESLTSYVVQFESNPDRTIDRLKKQLAKRGPDPIGYFLLAWFYHRKDLQDEAIACALKAKTLAPGSPFFDKLHYFFTHPKMFEAWRYQTDKQSLAKASFYSEHAVGPILDLNTLIEKLSEVESRKLRRENVDTTNAKPASSHDQFSDDIASETLAKIHEQQQKYGTAINTYEKLKKNNPHKEKYYNQEIERLNKLLDEQSKED